MWIKIAILLVFIRHVSCYCNGTIVPCYKFNNDTHLLHPSWPRNYCWQLDLFRKCNAKDGCRCTYKIFYISHFMTCETWGKQQPCNSKYHSNKKSCNEQEGCKWIPDIDDSLTDGEIAGIVIGCIFGCCCIFFGCPFICFYRPTKIHPIE